MPPTGPEAPGMTIIYDGQCPFCTAYVRMLRLRDGVGPVRLVDARSAAAPVVAARAAGLDLDDGMVVTYGGVTYHGDRAMHLLSVLSTPSGLFNRALGRVFRSERAARLLYPALVSGRRLTLTLLGRRRIGADPPARD